MADGKLPSFKAHYWLFFEFFASLLLCPNTLQLRPPAFVAREGDTRRKEVELIPISHHDFLSAAAALSVWFYKHYKHRFECVDT